MLRNLLVTVYILITTATAVADTDRYYKTTGKIDYFGTGDIKQSEVVIDGYFSTCTTCSYNVIIRVTDPYEGKEPEALFVKKYYEFTIPIHRLDKYLREHKDDTKEDFESIKKMADQMLSNFSRKIENPDFFEKKDEYGQIYCHLIVSKDYFKRFINMKTPIFQHHNSEEGSIYIAWVPELNQTIDIGWCGV